MCTADVEEYAHIAEYSWLMNQDSLHASVDWRERRRNVADLDLAAVTAAPLPVSSKRTTISLEASPFLLDSACTTHISPERSDFLTLHPIVDRTVTGVGGSSINALGIGSIKLFVAKGSSVLLENVLFIPASTVRLISIACITESLQCSVTFDASSVILKIALGLSLPLVHDYPLGSSTASTVRVSRLSTRSTRQPSIPGIGG